MSLTISQSYGYAYFTDAKQVVRVWWIKIEIPNQTYISYPVVQKLNRNQLRTHLRHFNKYRSISGYKYPDTPFSVSVDVAREKAFAAGWFNYGKFSTYAPLKGTLTFSRNRGK